VLEIIPTWKLFPHSLPGCAQYVVHEGIEADRRLFLLWKRNLEAGLMWKMTWQFALSITEPGISLLSNSKQAQPPHWV